MYSLRAIAFIFLAPLLAAPMEVRTDDFSITLERTACLGSCPEYTVTILASGSVRYEGRLYVRVKGIRKNTIPVSSVQRLIQKLRDRDFFHWEEKRDVCLDFPEVNITATLNGQTKHVLEGCNTPGRILDLANEIDMISGVKQWVGDRR